MPLVAVGGHARKVGKTSVACRLLESLAEWNWTAMKVSAAQEGECPVNGFRCGCKEEQHRLLVREEHRASNADDTSRFLRAGARRSFWVRTKSGALAEAVPFLREALRDGRSLLVEGTGIVRYVRPDVFVMVLRSDVNDFKLSAREVLDRVTCMVVVRPVAVPAVNSLEALDGAPNAARFEVSAPDFYSQGLVRHVSRRLEELGAQDDGPHGPGGGR